MKVVKLLVGIFDKIKSGTESPEVIQLAHLPIWKICGYKSHKQCMKALNIKLKK